MFEAKTSIELALLAWLLVVKTRAMPEPQSTHGQAHIWD